jgi:hypothetical protein
MAIVRNMESITLERDSKHSEVDATYSTITSENGEKFLQIDTYGSSDRQEKGKKSQSIRFSPEAINQLKDILAKL